ncbi:hypothetical protein D3C80_1487760 [compost metagenome]
MVGMQIIVPIFGLLIFCTINWRTISTPLISSPCNPAENKTVGPSIWERSMITGIFNFVIVWSFAISIFNVRLSPGRIVSPKIVMFFAMFFNRRFADFFLPQITKIQNDFNFISQKNKSANLRFFLKV